MQTILEEIENLSKLKKQHYYEGLISNIMENCIEIISLLKQKSLFTSISGNSVKTEIENKIDVLIENTHPLLNIVYASSFKKLAQTKIVELSRLYPEYEDVFLIRLLI